MVMSKDPQSQEELLSQDKEKTLEVAQVLLFNLMILMETNGKPLPQLKIVKTDLQKESQLLEELISLDHHSLEKLAQITLVIKFSLKLILHGHKTSSHQTFQSLLPPSPQLVLNTAQIDLREKPLEEESLELFHSQIKDSTATQICIQVLPELHGHMPSDKLLLLQSTQLVSNIAQTYLRDKLLEMVKPNQSHSQQRVLTASQIFTQVKKVPQLHIIEWFDAQI